MAYSSWSKIFFSERMNRYLPGDGILYEKEHHTLRGYMGRTGKKKGKDMAPPAGRAGGILNPVSGMTFYVAYHVVYWLEEM